MMPKLICLLPYLEYNNSTPHAKGPIRFIGWIKRQDCDVEDAQLRQMHSRAIATSLTRVANLSATNKTLVQQINATLH